MKAKRPSKSKPNTSSPLSLETLLDRRHPLVQLAHTLDWSRFEDEFGVLYAESGRPGLPTRLLVGLHYLKHAHQLSDEEVVMRWVENPYWQYFCGEVDFRHTLPLDPSSLTRWRQRVGEAGAEQLLSTTIAAGLTLKVVKPTSLERVIVDTTVQEKAIRFPTDARLYERCREHLVKLVHQVGLRLRQSYARVGPRTLIQLGRYAKAKQMKRKRKAQRKLKTYLARVYRDIERQLVRYPWLRTEALTDKLAQAQRLLAQTRTSKNKLYSLHAPEVECIAKGKAHKHYEFGVKVSLVVSHRECFVLGSHACPGNPYDGHTLEEALAQAHRLSGTRATECVVDKGYQGVAVEGVTIYRSGQKRGVKTRRLKNVLRRRNAVEPVIGHMKADGWLGRNYLKGELGDAMNAILSGAGHNIRLLLRAVTATWRAAHKRSAGAQHTPALSAA